MASLIEIMQLCRLCLVKDQVNIPIFEEQGDIRQIFLKISACLPVKVSREDNLPKKICDTCSSKLESLYQFWNTSANSEKQLLKWLSQVGVEKTSGRVAQSHSINSDGVVLKQEVVELADTHSVDDDLAPDDLNISNDAHDYILQQQQLPYQPLGFQFQQDGFTEGEGTSSTSGPSATVTSEAADAPKRKRRAAAMKALPSHIDSEEEDEDDVDMVETKIAKTEEQTDESGAEDPEPTAFVGVPSTSADNEQPGPSGVGKGAAEATSMNAQSPLQAGFIVPKSEEFSEQNAIAAPQLNSVAVPNQKVGVIMTPQGLITVQQFIIALPNINVASASHRNFTQANTDIKPNLGVDVAQNLNAKTSSITNTSTISSRNRIKQCKCNHCGKNFKCKSHLDNHLKTHLPKQKYECNVCKAVLANKRNHQRHMIIHSEDRPYSCEICMKPFKLKQNMKGHMLLHTSERAFKCEICSRTFKTKVALRSHTLGLHNEKLEHICEMCNRGFITPSKLKIHINAVHNKLFTCEICNEKCKSHYKYKRHQLSHKGITILKNYVCQICRKGYEYAKHLKQHVGRVHEGIRKQYICDLCGKITTSEAVLQAHKLRHDGIRPFQCNNCGKMFYSNKELKVHAVVHTGEKPYSCEICKKKFTQKGTLNIHMRLHTGETPYECDLCKKTFISRTLLNSHKKSKYHRLM